MPEPRCTTMTRRSVGSAGVMLAAWEGPANGPTVLFVHGFPDTHVVWSAVVDEMSPRFRCLTYDVRGAGLSDVPPSQDDYRLTYLVDDLVAVLDALSPTEPVHLVAHDWGSIQAWEAVIREKSDPRLTGRIASYTTISGPCLHHVAAFSRSARRSGWTRGRSGGLAKKRAALQQLARSWYVFAFHVPKVPELVLGRLEHRLLDPGGSAAAPFAETLRSDAVNGLNLYRANIFHLNRPPGGAGTTLPVLAVVPLRDKYVTPALIANLARFASQLTRVEIDASHWVPRTHPRELAELIADFVGAHPTGG